MKDFYRIRESVNPDNVIEYRNHKRETVLKTIKPICDAFGIDDYDYYYVLNREYLEIEGQKIACTLDSIGAIVNELICYIFLNTAYQSKLAGYHDSDAILERIMRCFQRDNIR
jgi:hypothetical protein